MNTSVVWFSLALCVCVCLRSVWLRWWETTTYFELRKSVVSDSEAHYRMRRIDEAIRGNDTAAIMLHGVSIAMAVLCGLTAGGWVPTLAAVVTLLLVLVIYFGLDLNVR